LDQKFKLCEFFYIPAFIFFLFHLLTDYAKVVETETFLIIKNVIRNAEKIVKQLYRAIELGELEDVKHFQIELDINFQDRNGITPLYFSVFHNQTELVSYY
jgi:hypothetical protein